MTEFVPTSRAGCVRLARIANRELIRAMKSKRMGTAMFSRTLRDRWMQHARKKV